MGHRTFSSIMLFVPYGIYPTPRPQCRFKFNILIFKLWFPLKNWSCLPPSSTIKDNTVNFNLYVQQRYFRV